MERDIPFDLQAERATLGACLLDREAVLAVAGWLAPEQFYLQKYDWIYTAILHCYQQRVPPDIATVADELRRRERLEAVGGYGFLGELVAEVPTALHVEYYARIVERCAVRRTLIETGGKIVALGYAEQDDLSETLAKAEAALFAVSQRRGGGGGFVHMAQATSEALARLDRTAQGGDTGGVLSGLADLDALTGGFLTSDLIILAGRPSMGKSALGLTLAMGAAEQGARVGIFSLEMSREQLVDRQIAMVGRLDAQRVRTKQLRLDEFDRAVRALGHIEALPILIDDTPGLTSTELRHRARRAHSAEPFDLLLIDYLGKVKGRARDRVQEVSEVVRDLKDMARELNIPVIALAQLSRAVEGRADKVPGLSDLRDSGEIEQEADLVGFLHRAAYYDHSLPQSGRSDLYIAKHRNGPLGEVPLFFNAASVRFDSLHSLSHIRQAAD